jgi:hypothetical protein
VASTWSSSVVIVTLTFGGSCLFLEVKYLVFGQFQ